MEAVLEQPRVTEQISLKSYDSYYLDMCRAIEAKIGRAKCYIKLYKAVGILVDEINRGRKSFKLTPRRRMTYWDYRLSKRIEKARKMGHDPRYVSGKAPRKREKQPRKIRRRAL